MSRRKVMPLYIFLLSIGLFAACGKEESVDEDYNKGVIAVGRAMTRLTQIKASDLGATIRYVPLETTKQSEVGALPRVKLTNDYLFVLSRGENLKMFDRKTGKYIRTIGSLNDSLTAYNNLYKMLSCWIDESNQTIYFEGHPGELVQYDFQGEFQRNLELPDSVHADNTELIYYNIRQDTIDAYSRSRISYRPRRLYRTMSDGTVKRAYLTKYNPPPAGWKRRAEYDEVVLGTYTKFGGHFRRIGYDKRSFYFIKDTPMLWTFDGYTRFKEDFVNTIYNVTNEGLQPYLTFDLGKWDWPFDERYLINRCVHRLAVDYVLEGDETVYFHFHEGLYGYGTYRKAFCGVYDKRTGYTKAMRGDSIRNDITHLMPFVIQESANGAYCAVIEAWEVKDWMERNKDMIDSQAKKLFKGLKEHDNPIVVIIE